MFGVILLLLVVSSLPNQTASSAYDDADAYEVYAAILPSDPLRVADAKQLVIRRETKAFRMCLKPESEIEAKVGPAIADYVKLNERKWLLQPKLSFPIPSQFLETNKFDALISQGGGWPEYYRQYPESGGVIEFSAVGFNVDKTIAVVYMGHLCGPLCGGGTFHVLEKRDGKWKELEWKGDSCAWKS